MNDRSYWLQKLEVIAKPVLVNLNNGTLKSNFPFIETPNEKNLSPLEATARLILGIAPWLEAKGLSDEEEAKRKEYADLIRSGIGAILDKDSSDYIELKGSRQALVELAQMSQGILRAPIELWEKLDIVTKRRYIDALKASRMIKPNYSNWLLFSAMIETALYTFGQESDPMRIDYALRQHENWYLGDGMYGDGPSFHWDYYNSFVIQPMLLDIIRIVGKNSLYPKDCEWIDFPGYKCKNCEADTVWATMYDKIIYRAKRYAVILERMISPEGTFPPIGRSLPYRFGAFHLLSQLSLIDQLPKELSPAGVRSALTAVLKRVIEMPGTFDDKGWLTIGFCGNQSDIRECYISRGSIYLCSTLFLPLGLPPDDKFWSGKSEDWSSKKIWSGENCKNDHAI